MERKYIIPVYEAKLAMALLFLVIASIFLGAKLQGVSQFSMLLLQWLYSSITTLKVVMAKTIVMCLCHTPYLDQPLTVGISTLLGCDAYP